MFGHNFMDEIDCGSFFDHIDDLLEFSGDDVDPWLPSAGSDTFPTIWPTDSGSLPCSDSVFSGHNNSDLSAELPVPIEDIVQLEWLSSFVEDSLSDRCLAIAKNGLKNKEDSSSQRFHTSSPVSVLESSSSCSGEKNVPRSPFYRRGRARSKRPRPATFNPPRPAAELISPTSSVTETTTPAIPEPLSDHYAESGSVVKELKHEKKKKKKKVKLPLSVGSVINQVPISQPVRKCMHCEITKTPQWRAGPMGPKTLCNACGVRYKSGRLFPEYRPAASPTFVPSVHSNSHKKVVEMRNKGTMELPSSPELIPNTNNAILFDHAGVAPSRNLSLRCTPNNNIVSAFI